MDFVSPDWNGLDSYSLSIYTTAGSIPVLKNLISFPFMYLRLLYGIPV